MKKQSAGSKNAACLVDISRLVKSVPLDQKLRAQLSKSNREVASLAKKFEGIRRDLDDITKELESQDRMGNFEIQRLMSVFNQAETLASSVLKKRDETASAIISKIG